MSPAPDVGARRRARAARRAGARVGVVSPVHAWGVIMASRAGGAHNRGQNFGPAPGALLAVVGGGSPDDAGPARRGPPDTALRAAAAWAPGRERERSQRCPGQPVGAR